MTHSGFDFKGLTSTDKATGYTTTGDLYKWDRALYTDRIISQSSLQKALDNQPSAAGPGKIAADINALLHGQPYSIPHERVAITVDTNTLKQYVGVIS